MILSGHIITMVIGFQLMESTGKNLYSPTLLIIWLFWITFIFIMPCMVSVILKAILNSSVLRQPFIKLKILNNGQHCLSKAICPIAFSTILLYLTIKFGLLEEKIRIQNMP